jgi:lipopolysaccharide export LptBFGC system permease protein LptF
MLLQEVSTTHFEGVRTTFSKTQDFSIRLEVDLYKNYNPIPRYRNWNRLLEALDGSFPEGEVWQEMSIRVAKGVIPFPLALMGAALGILTRRSSRMAGLGLGIPPLAAAMTLLVAAEGFAAKTAAEAVACAAVPLALAGAASAWAVWKIKS